MNEKTSLFREDILDESRIADLKLAASKIPAGHERRSFQAEIALKYLGGNPRRTEEIFGWSRDAVEVGLHEKRTGIVCLSARKGRCGDKLWEDKHPEAAEALMEIAESYAQQDPTFRTTVAYTRLTAAEALKQLSQRGFPESSLPSPRCMADVLNRNGYRLRPVVKAKPQKKVKGTNSQFMNIKNNVETMLGWAKSMTWKGLHPFVNLCRKEYRKGISLSKKAMEKVELRLERNPLLPKWDILIQPQQLW